MNGNVTYHQQVSYCGKPRCRKCREGVGHGPYWYAYRNENGRTTRTYIGKELPLELQSAQDTTNGVQEHTLAEADPAVIRIRVLGQFQLERQHGRQWQSVTEAVWQHQRVRSVLACLLSNVGRKWGREQLMDALWPELDLENASGRLDRAVHSLRQLFEPSLERPATSRLLRSERESLVLADQQYIWVDADAFEQLIAKANASSDSSEKEQLLEEAVALYGGDFLPEEQQADWAIARREMLQRAWMGLLLELTDLRIARGALFNAIEPLDRILMADPANEAAVQRLMVSLTHLDRRGEALQSFSRFSSALKRLYNITPLSETRQLYQAIQQGNTPVLTSHTSHNSTGAATDIRNASNGDTVQQARPVNRTPFGRTHQNPLIGRDFEVEELRQLLLNTEESTHASASSRKKFSILPSDYGHRPQCAVLVGEAGIGKTRLAEEISREAQQRGWTIAWSRVYAQESGVPFRQWTEVLRNAMTHGLLPKQEMSRHPLVFQPLASLLPELHAVLPQVTFPVPLSPEQEQLRLWEATLALLVTISERTPLLLVLDDFHWADVSSSELFAYLVRRLHGHPIAIIGTYRDNELPAQHPLRSVLTALQREQVMAHLPLQPLTKEQIARLVDYLPQSVVQHIQNQAAGNPFFAEELARGLSSATTAQSSASATFLSPSAVSDGTPDGQVQANNVDITDNNGMLPDTIAAVLELRMRRLSVPCQRLLGNAAVLGGSFEFTTLIQMEAGGVNLANPTNEDTILDLIEEALQAGVITEEGTGTHVSYHFWHPLLASHLYDKLSAARRASLHRRAANVLQHIFRNHEEEGAAAITHHLVEGGGNSQNIIYYAELAGNHAYALSAYPEAERYYRIAATHLEEIHAGQGMPEGEHERSQLAYLLERLGECARFLGNYEEARNLYERVLRERSHQRDFAAQEEYQHEVQIDALLWIEIGWTWYSTGNLAFAQQCCNHAETILREAEIKAGTAWGSLRFQQSYIYWQEGKYDEAQETAQDALKLFGEKVQQRENSETVFSQLTATKRTLAGDSVNLGRTHALLGAIANSIGQPTKALTHLNTALTIYEQYNCQREIANVTCNIGDAHLRKAEFLLAQAAFRRSLHLAERVGDVPLMSILFGNLGVLAARTGNLAESEIWFKQGIHLAGQIKDQVYMSMLHANLALTLVDQGKFEEAKLSVHSSLTIGRTMDNIPCISTSLVALGYLRFVQAIEIREVQNTNEKEKSILNSEAKQKRLLRRARTALEHALSLEGLESDTRIEGQLILANILLYLFEINKAHQQIDTIFNDANDHELTRELAQAQNLMGSILVVQEKLEQADGYFLQALQTFNKYGMRLEYARTLHNHGLLLLNHKDTKQQNYSLGISNLNEAQQIFSECHATLDLQRVENVLHTITHASA
ncbi:MAG: DUF6788 family protein [Ktedonobacteraceae bacterium]